MKKIFAFFVCIVTLVFNIVAQENELKMVKIPGTNFEMLEHEVTLSLYESVMGEKPENLQKANNNLAKNVLGDFGIKIKNTKVYYYQETGIHDNHPVIAVSFYDAIYFCNKLSVINGLTPVYAVKGETDVDEWDYIPHQGKFIKADLITVNSNSNGYRLPTAAEWLYAAKGGQEYLYPGSDNIDEVAWYKDNSNKTTHEIAQKKANGYGLYDMLGNVEEWTFNLEKHLSDEEVIESRKALAEMGMEIDIYDLSKEEQYMSSTNGHSYKTGSSACKRLFTNRSSYVRCDIQDIDRGFRIVRSIIE